MKHIIFFTLAFVSISSQAQTWTVARTRDSVLAIIKREAATKDKLAIKDFNDDKRNFLIDSLFSENRKLRESNDVLKALVDSAKIYPSLNDFIVDSTRKLSLRPKSYTIIIKHNEP